MPYHRCAQYALKNPHCAAIAMAGMEFGNGVHRLGRLAAGRRQKYRFEHIKIIKIVANRRRVIVGDPQHFA